jgi:hypothetical protein
VHNGTLWLNERRNNVDKLKQVQRYYEAEGGVFPSVKGELCSYDDAQARERVLVDALRDIAAGTYSHGACVRGREILAQYDAEQEGK